MAGSTKKIMLSGVCVKSCPSASNRKLDYAKDDTTLCSAVSTSKIYASRSLLSYCIPDLEDLEKVDPLMVKAWTKIKSDMSNTVAGK